MTQLTCDLTKRSNNWVFNYNMDIYTNLVQYSISNAHYSILKQKVGELSTGN